MKRYCRDETLKVVVKIIASVICISACILISPLGFLYLTFGYEEIAIKKAIDNPYVNSKYCEWEIVVEEIGNFHCPSDWQYLNDNGTCRVLDTNGNVWAIGTKFGTENDAFSSRKDFAETVIGKQISVFEISTCPGSVYMDGSQIGMIEVKADSYMRLYCLQLTSYGEPEIFFIVLKDLQEDGDAFDIAEAIVYSYAYY